MAPGAQGGVVGLLYVASLQPGAFTEDDEQNLEVLATQTAELLRRLSARILDERRKMELMVASMADGLIMTDATGEVFLINPAARKMLGVVDDGAHRRDGHRQVSEGEARLLSVRSRALDRAAPSTLREELKVNDRFLHSIVSPVNDTGGAPVGVVVVLRDITEQKALDHRKEEFVSIVSHELRTPLTSITGALDIVLKQYGAGLTDKQPRYVEMARDSAQQAQRHRRRSPRRGQGRARQIVDAHGRARSGGAGARRRRALPRRRRAEEHRARRARARPPTARCASSPTPIA